MEQRLKRERNRLFLRIILILLAVWLIVSAVFCAIRLNIEKANIQSRELSELSRVKQTVDVKNDTIITFKDVFLKSFGFVSGGNDDEHNYDVQLILTDTASGKACANTANAVAVPFRLALNEPFDEQTFDFTAILDYDMIRDALSDKQFEEIKKLLNTKRSDGNYYELICTKLYYDITIVPYELKIVLVDAKDDRFCIDDNAATYTLDKYKTDKLGLYNSSSVNRNVIPKDFILNGRYHRDIIGSLSKQQLKSTDMINTGLFEYIFYTSDHLNFNEEDSGKPDESTGRDGWTVQYAKRVNILDSCKGDLPVGTAVIFGFVLTIAVILCVMIWRTVKAQIVQEQKRLDLTNALAHDVKTPLFVISGYAYSLKEDIDETERDKYLDKIIEQTEEVNSLVHRMLDFSKLDSYKMTLNKTELDLSEKVGKLLKEYAVLPGNKTMTFTHRGKSLISADSELIDTALKNLIDNAVKYSLPDSEIRVDVTGKTFSVSNQSEPLSKAELKQLREPYVRKDKSRRQKGNGLGLSIVSSIVQLHGARFDMSMKGSVLTCRIEF